MKDYQEGENPDKTQKRYLLNTNSKKIHDLENVKGSCRIKIMRKEYMQYFDSLEDALNYPNSEHPLAQKCSFCFEHRKLKEKIFLFAENVVAGKCAWNMSCKHFAHF